MDEPDPNDEAFCPILWQANGGVIGPNGSISHTDGPIRGRCRNPGDCDRCTYMQQSLVTLTSQGVTSLWICSSCAGQVRNLARDLNIETRLPGFFTEGFCQRPQCHKVGEARYSSILQLLTVFGTVIP